MGKWFLSPDLLSFPQPNGNPKAGLGVPMLTTRGCALAPGWQLTLMCSGITSCGTCLQVPKPDFPFPLSSTDFSFIDPIASIWFFRIMTMSGSQLYHHQGLSCPIHICRTNTPYKEDRNPHFTRGKLRLTPVWPKWHQQKVVQSGCKFRSLTQILLKFVVFLDKSQIKQVWKFQGTYKINVLRADTLSISSLMRPLKG